MKTGSAFILSACLFGAVHLGTHHFSYHDGSSSSIVENTTTDPQIEKSWTWELFHETTKLDYEDDSPDVRWPLWTPEPHEKHSFLRLTTRMLAEESITTESYGNGTSTNTTESSEAHAEGGHSDLSVHVAYEDIYDVIIFIAVAWVMGQLSLWVGVPTLVGEIITGCVLGPPVLNFVPYEEAIVLMGEIGLIGLLLEAGVEIDVAQLKETGARAFLMAVTGSLFPLVVGLGLAMASPEHYSFRTAIAVGACFSPTSLGVASNALGAGKILNTPVGQLIIAACVVDDIIGLLLLSCLKVLVDDDAQVWEYFIPIISSFGYLVVLGLSAVTWMPRVIENQILPRIKEEYRELAALCMMFALLIAYLPLLNYSRSSPLLGAFLAGLPFSTIPSIHATFVHSVTPILTWLLRIFFASVIGFQIPIKYYNDGFVIMWAFIFCVPVLMKLPLGFFVPKFQESSPKDFPFNPYVRDVVVTAIAMTCRGEFSFVIAAFALAEGLFDERLYAAIVLAVLISCVTSPFILLQRIGYYNNLAEAFLLESHDCDCDTHADGTMPLYIQIQMRTPNMWGLQEKFRRIVDKCGLTVIDHRSWHPRGRAATVVTEAYLQDTQLRVTAPSVDKKQLKSNQQDNDNDGEAGKHEVTIQEDEALEDSELAENEDMKVEKRCEEIRRELLILIEDAVDFSIQVTRWCPQVFAEEDESTRRGSSKRYSFVALGEGEKGRLLSEISATLNEHSYDGTNEHDITEPDTFVDPTEQDEVKVGPRRRRPVQKKPGSPHSGPGRRVSMMQAPSTRAVDLWSTDDGAQEAALQAVELVAPRVQTGTGPSYGARRRTSAVGILRPTNAALMDLPTVDEHLGGLVRTTQEDAERRAERDRQRRASIAVPTGTRNTRGSIFSRGRASANE